MEEDTIPVLLHIVATSCEKGEIQVRSSFAVNIENERSSMEYASSEV